jgi:nucleobase:cation symporter-1, NCS1 family
MATVETHSIDHVPRSERHGRAWHQAPFWFTGNFVISTMVVGFVGPSQGLALGWAVLASALGALFGTFFMAFHANQGPTMGLPQMIQSRAQFGVRGVMVPLLAVLFVYIGFSVFGVMLTTQALTMVLPGDATLWYPVVIAAAALIAIVGYDLLHLLLRYLTYLVVPVFVIVTVIAVATLDPHAGPAGGHFSASLFLVQFAAAAGYQISYAVYVSDYSRYLPADTPGRAVIGWTYLGAALSSIWLTALGGLIASSFAVPDAVGNLQAVGDRWFDGFGTFAVVASIVPSAIAITGVNAYGSMLAGVTIVEGFRPVRSTARLRIAGIVLFGVVVYVVVRALPAGFLDNFNSFVTMMLYLLVPWTAVNLADFYWVRRGRYAITEIFDPNGIYGRWGWRGLGAYLVGFAAMAPFMSTTFFTGPANRALDGADVSFAVGLLVAGIVYLVLMRGFDLGEEEPAVAASARLLHEPEDAAAAAPAHPPAELQHG